MARFGFRFLTELIFALKRFGIPLHVVDIIKSIYSGMIFRVKDKGSSSKPGSQKNGICQGCPLSLFLPIIVMTVLMDDAYEILGSNPSRNLCDILYADDTLVLGSDSLEFSKLARAVQQASAMYGMRLHWGKVQAVHVQTGELIFGSDGKLVKSSPSVVRLGGLIPPMAEWNQNCPAGLALQMVNSWHCKSRGRMQSFPCEKK